VKVFSVVGNRPQFIKAAPTSVALREHGIDEVVLHTGQHYDRELSQIFFEELALAEPRYRLDLHTADTDAMRVRIVDPIRDERPDWVLVYGDTNSTLAGALAAAENALPLAHVEAGMRSGDLTMPEERNRIETDRIAQLLLCPDERSRDQLAGEGAAGRAEVVGDVMADATRTFAPVARARTDARALAGLRDDEPYAALTIHREANTRPDRLRRLIGALAETGWTFVFPVHPRTRNVLDEHRIEVGPHLYPIEPVGYLEMLALVASSTRVVTDSGGLQKEAYWLGVPCITLRPSTEWVDTVLAGANQLVDPDTPERLAPALSGARFPDDAPPLYGDGHAAARIAEALYSLTPA
jgi:UDP-N-acetylglucosamine 2-epimerase